MRHVRFERPSALRTITSLVHNASPIGERKENAHKQMQIRVRHTQEEPKVDTRRRGGDRPRLDRHPDQPREQPLGVLVEHRVLFCAVELWRDWTVC